MIFHLPAFFVTITTTLNDWQEYVAQASQAAEKMSCSVILSEAKNLSLFLFLYLNRREILRFAQNDRGLSFSAASSACGFWSLQGQTHTG
jgi:hypothetical protein